MSLKHSEAQKQNSWEHFSLAILIDPNYANTFRFALSCGKSRYNSGADRSDLCRFPAINKVGNWSKDKRIYIGFLFWKKCLFE